MAAAARHWACEAYGGVTFVDRTMPKEQPAGMRWKIKRSASTTSPKNDYEHHAIYGDERIDIQLGKDRFARVQLVRPTARGK